MAKEIQAVHSTTGATLYAQLLNSVGQIWNTAGTPAFETYATANIADYDIALTEAGTASKFWTGNMPSVAVGVYGLVVRVRAGGTPAESDSLVTAGQVFWSGTALQYLGLPQTGDSFALIGANGAGLTAVVAASVTGSVGGSVTGNVEGNVAGKVLGGGIASMTNVGVRAYTDTGASAATASSQTTILARLGSWTGTGINTILGAFQAAMGKTASLTPSDITAAALTYDNTTDSLEAVRDNLGTNGAALTAVPWNAAWDAEVQSECADALTAHGVTITYAGTVLTGGSAEINQETDYNDTIGNALTWTVTGLPTIPSNAVVTLNAERGTTTFSATGSYVSATSFKVPINGDLTTTALLPAGQYKMQVIVTSATWGASKEVMYVDAPLTVKGKI